ncbi:MAG: metallophosphatase family protein [Acidobacteriia bacterium]|nr:metallophosphatase family protein [Terriglobia bacterium]
MRILLLSDIHANSEALDACLAEAPEHDLVVNLGDVVGYGASPNEVIERSRALGKVFVRGNHDKACSGISSMEDFNPIAGLAVIWTRTVLRKENLEWLRVLPQGPARIDGVSGVQLVHGSPHDEDEYLLLLPEALRSLDEAEPWITFFGHTHVQGGFFASSDDSAAIRPVYNAHAASEKFLFQLRKNVRYMINPGSVGQPRDGDWRAAFALFDTDAYTVTYYRVKYDVAGAQKRIIAADLPERLATRLAQGR